MAPRTVYLLSYPRSGSTLLRQHLAALQGRPQLSAYPGDVVVPEGPALTATLDEVRVVKSHGVGSHATPAIVLVRDGRSASVSNLFLKELSGDHPPLRRGDLADGLRQLAAEGESWPDHVHATLDLAERGDVAVVRFEDLVADPVSTLSHLCEVLGATVPTPVLARAASVVAASGAYAANPLNGHGAVLGPDSLFGPLVANRGGDHWRDAFDPPARRCFHEQGATPLLLRFGYESDPDWWAA